MTIPTPEGVEIELTLAGIGSRFAASVIDTAFKVGLFIGLILALFGGARLLEAAGVNGASFIGDAIFSVMTFLIFFGYDVLFETLANGRTPGKRWTALRVVKIGGRPVGFMASAIRNLLRLIDILPGFYVVGMVCVSVTALNQRLGDLAAGTVVVRERAPIKEPLLPTTSVPVETDVSDVSAITATELVTVRKFLERRSQLTPQARAQLATELWTRLRTKVAGFQDLPPEPFLEQIAAAKARRS